MTTNTPTLFSSGEFELSIMPSAEHGFIVIASSLAKALGFRDAFRLTESIPADQKGYTTAETPGGPQKVWYLTEAGFYHAIGRRQPARIKDPAMRAQVERFQAWVFSDVLPSVRRHGMYATPDAVDAMLSDPDMAIRLLQQIKEERAARAALEEKAMRDAPKVLFADAVSMSDSTILVGDLAKILRGNGIDIGATRLFSVLRKHGYLVSRKGSDWNSPTQKAMDLGLFKIKETAVTHSDGHVTVNRTPKVTGKGQAYFIDRFLSGRLNISAA
ncbi:phage antirepressor KilAC domain-containing protein [Devriesea agamarum]|uniref:phage antirepressor KilAC domain-containing protein n=1 Tax=Devriesea agamarum TaxID=472569 RepID=UPI00071C7006|nr:phage antirepressor KilAC domain-containing protein [Devriesea agamarum]